MTDDWRRAVAPPLHVSLGLASAFGGALLETHEGTLLSHAPHQLLLAVPLALLAALLLGARERDLWVAAACAAGGLALGDALLAAAGGPH